ncbi:MAG: TlpA family protein disulfide reductase [Bacteroidales bacterium]|nr:TlpA family protein disulfide reductase [Bacteroidales bacterium]
MINNKRLKTKLLIVGGFASLMLLSSNKKEAESQVYADQISSIDGIEQVCGGSISSDSLKGKMIVLNFWASYDAQSRINSYKLLQLKQEFEGRQFHNGNGIDVVSISLDKFKAPLRKAIQTDGTESFHHICDYKGIDSDWAKLFDVYRPVNLLIDADGMVVARDFNVQTLNSTLEMLCD